MGIALALLSALSYGISDVIGGLAARRVSPLRVALIGQIGGLCVTALAMLVVTTPPLRATDLAWGACSGVGTGLAMAFLFRGISRGAMSVVVPVAAVGGVALPVLISAVVLGERPPGLTWLGMLIALPALWFVSRSPDGGAPVSRGAVLDGFAASGGIAIQYLCLAQADAHAGLSPILSGRVAAVATVIVAAVTIMRVRTHTSNATAMSPPVLALSVGAGVLAATALAAYLFALRTEYVTVTVILASLYPIVPVVVGLAFLGERLRPPQTFGLLGALIATLLIVLA